ncbi:BRCA1 C Terminus domain-containing protein [Apiospora marii]|uniref:BRCA1 C Terminus domain-containing protein n=1 Tax=Apiospora marii TaxID=335849 RepID=A0ABR1SFB2_9PEZI
MVPPPTPPRSGGTTAKPKTPAGAVGGAAASTTTPGVSPTKAAQPQFGTSFDPWNSSSSGHQRAENRLGASTGWRDSRNAKLHSQFRGDAKRVSDAVGAGARHWDPKLQAVVPPELRARARCSVADMLAKPGTMQRSLSSLSSPASTSLPPTPSSIIGVDTATVAPNKGDPSSKAKATEEGERPAGCAKPAENEDQRPSPDQEEGPGRLFAGVVIYVNGSTHPQISDHKLKHVLAKNGGRLSSHLGRKQVTHVILGRPIGGGGGFGGGLAGSKLQKEIQKVRGAAVKFVGVEWVLESIKAGKRLPEARFGNLKVASKGQQSVFRPDSKSTPPPPALAASSAESCIEGSGVSLYPAPSDTLGDAPPPSAQRY